MIQKRSNSTVYLLGSCKMSLFSKKWCVPLREYEFTDYDYIKTLLQPNFLLKKRRVKITIYIYIRGGHRLIFLI